MDTQLFVCLFWLAVFYGCFWTLERGTRKRRPYCVNPETFKRTFVVWEALPTRGKENA